MLSSAPLLTESYFSLTLIDKKNGEKFVLKSFLDIPNYNLGILPNGFIRENLRFWFIWKIRFLESKIS